MPVLQLRLQLDKTGDTDQMRPYEIRNSYCIDHRVKKPASLMTAILGILTNDSGTA